MKAIGIILKKELKRYFTDVRMLLGIFLPGIIIFSLYTFMGDMITGAVSGDDINTFEIYVENEPSDIEVVRNTLGYDFHVNFEDYLTKDEILDKIANKEVSLYVVFPENFEDLVSSYDSLTGQKAPNVEIYYNSTASDSSKIYSIYTEILNSYETNMANKFDINNSDIIYDLAKKDDTSKMILTMMLPFILMIFLFSSSMAFCSEAISGEKERGTIATLLVTPVKRSQIAIGKVIALGLTSLASAFVSFIGLIASLPKLVGTNITLGAYDVGTILMLLGVIIVTVLIFTTILTMVSTFAKSVKEASSYSLPIMIVVMLLGATSFMGTQAVTNPALYLIPVYGAIQALTGILSVTITPLNYFVFLISNIVYILLGVYLLTKMFNSEKIMFNK